MKVTLVYCSISQTGFNSFGKNYTASWFSHGLTSISAYAKRESFDVNLIDLRKLKDWNDFENILTAEKSDVVATGIMTVDYDYGMKVMNIAKKLGCITAIGGVHVTVDPDSVIKNKNIDYIIKGEGEISFTNLLKDIEKGKENFDRVIEGIRPNLDELPYDDRELFDYEKIINVPFSDLDDILPTPTVTIMTQRGCKYNCSFCQPSVRILFGKKVRKRSVEHVIDELKILRQKYSFRSLVIHDDTFVQDKDYVLEFCKRYKEEGFSQPFWCSSRADIVCRNPQMHKTLKDAGLAILSIGFESGNQRILNILRKGTTVEQNYKAAEICKNLGIPIYSNFMLGIPTETKKEMRDTIKLIRKINPRRLGIAVYVPIPGSDLGDKCIKDGISLINSYDDYRRSGPAKIKGVDYRKLYWLRIVANQKMRFLKKLKNWIIIYFFMDFRGQYLSNMVVRSVGLLILKYWRTINKRKHYENSNYR